MSLYVYLKLDRLWEALTGYLVYRYKVTKCYFSPPRLGHDWDGGSLEMNCTRCPKHWVGNM